MNSFIKNKILFLTLPKNALNQPQQFVPNITFKARVHYTDDAV